MRYLAATFTILLLASPANAAWQDSRLNQVASTFAMRPVSVTCASEIEDEHLADAYGYIDALPNLKALARAKVAHLEASMCVGALNLNDRSLSAVQRAQGSSTLVHEAYHLRRWAHAADEGRVECQAIRHWKVTARLLGATEETIAELWPYALLLHYEQTRVVVWGLWQRLYYYEACAEPPLIDEDE